MIQAARITTAKLAIRGLRHIVLDRGNSGNSLTECNALEVVHNAINHRLGSALDEWERTGSQPNWDQVLDSIPTNGEAYIGPSGGWIEFGDEDTLVITRVASQEVAWVRQQLDMVREALDTRS